MRVPTLISRAQSSSLFGLAGSMERGYSPYKRAFGDEATAYDLNQPGAVAEVKAALRALAQVDSNPEGNPAPVIETVWKAVGDDDVWDFPTALEFVLFVSRALGRHSTQVPYTQQPMYPSLPQPSVMGLELLASEVNDRLKGVPSLKLYEAWRGGPLRPPTVVNRPAPNTPVTPTFAIRPNALLPQDAPQDKAAVVAAADKELAASFAAAYGATNEIDRDAAAHNAIAAMKSRSSAMLAASIASPTQQEHARQCLLDGGSYEFDKQRCVMPRPLGPPLPPVVEPERSGALPWILGGAVLLGLGFAAYKARKR